MTIDFYDTFGDEFFVRTKDIDMQSLYEPFLALLPEKARILDAGCGSGRDTLAFRKRGFDVSAIDASKKLVMLASQYTGVEVLHMSFDEMEFDGEFDGIWACASLLHVPVDHLPEVFERFVRALKPGGHWYFSFKVGQGERTVQGRLFTDFDRRTMMQFFERFDQLAVSKIWETADARPDRDDEKWLNVIVQRTN